MTGHETESTANVVVFGAINMDLVAVVPRLPKTGETVYGTTFDTVPGGKGANQAVACARLGARASMVGRVGDDAFGLRLRESLESYEVDISMVAVDAMEPSGIAQVTVDATGQNWITIVRGANGTCGQEELGHVADALRSADIVLLQLEIPLEISLEAARIAKSMARKVVLDPAPVTHLPPEIGPLFDFIIPNEVEASTLVGFAVGDVESAKQAAHYLQQQGFGGVVIKLGAQGCYYATAEGEGHLPGFSINVVDTVAAGDAFNGAFSVALAEGRSVSEAALRGNTAGAISVSRRGAQSSMPLRSELEALAEQKFAL